MVGRAGPLGGGTWLGVNRAGVVAAVLNRPGSLGPRPASAAGASCRLVALTHQLGQPTPRRPSPRWMRAFGAASTWCWLTGDGAVFVRGLGRRPAGALGLVRRRAHGDGARPGRSRQSAGRPPPAPLQMRRPADPDDWEGWQAILSDRSGERRASRSTSQPSGGFGTASSALLALPAAGPPRWLFAAGRAGRGALRAGSVARIAGSRPVPSGRGGAERRCYTGRAATSRGAATRAPAHRSPRGSAKGNPEWPAAASSTRARPRSCSRGPSPARSSSISRTTRPPSTPRRRA